MPPIQVDTGDGGVIRFLSDNPPLSPFADDFRTTRRPLAGARALLFHTDGLNEAVTTAGRLYRDHLQADLLAAGSRDALWRAFRARVPDPADDVTFLLLSRMDLPVLWEASFAIPPRLEAVDGLAGDLEELLAARLGLEGPLLDALGTSLREALMNGYEHGCLGIDGREKRRLLEEGVWLDHLLEVEPQADGEIRTRLALCDRGPNLILKATVADGGPGFKVPNAWPSERDLLALSGRGLKMIRKYSDGMYFNASGNEITFFRSFPRSLHADRAHGLP